MKTSGYKGWLEGLGFRVWGSEFWGGDLGISEGDDRLWRIDASKQTVSWDAHYSKLSGHLPQTLNSRAAGLRVQHSNTAKPRP